MIKNRQKRLIEELQLKNIDLAFILSPIHISYYTSFLSDPHERFFALIVDANENKTYLFVPQLDYEKGKDVAEVDAIIPISDTENGYEIVKRTFQSSINSIAIEKNIMTVNQLEHLKQVFEGATIQRIETFIANERLNKSRAEIEHVKKAIHITEEGIKHIINFVKVGMTEIEVKMELEFYLQSIGAEHMAFDSLVLSGPNSALPHGVSGTRKIEHGDFLLFDFGVSVNGYHSDTTRTFIVGTGTEEQQKIYETVRAANERAIEAIQVGKPIKLLDIAAREHISNEGYGEYFTHRVGHGLGLEIHEEPSIHGQNELQMTNGMLFTIEPGIYIPEVGGVRIEDDVYINEDGKAEVLTTFTKELTYIEG